MSWRQGGGSRTRYTAPALSFWDRFGAEMARRAAIGATSSICLAVTGPRHSVPRESRVLPAWSWRSTSTPSALRLAYAHAKVSGEVSVCYKSVEFGRSIRIQGTGAEGQDRTVDTRFFSRAN